MEELAFPPLILTPAGQEPVTITSVQEAWVFLTDNWPDTDLKSREKALKMCKFVLRGTASPHVVRDALLAVAKDAGLKVQQPSAAARGRAYPKTRTFR